MRLQVSCPNQIKQALPQDSDCPTVRSLPVRNLVLSVKLWAAMQLYILLSDELTNKEGPTRATKQLRTIACLDSYSQ